MADEFEYNPDDFMIESEAEQPKIIQKVKHSIASEVCPNCFSENSVFMEPHSGMVCKKCSAVVKSFITTKHNFATTDDSNGIGYSRCGGPVNPFLARSNGSITVGIGNKRAEKVQRWTALDYRQRTLWLVYQKMKHIAQANNIPTLVLMESKILYKALSSKEIITRAMPKLALEATCFFKACNIHKLGRTHKEVAKMFGVPVSYMTEGINKFNRLMMDTIHQDTLTSSETSTVPSYISRYCNLLLMNHKHVKVANAIAKNTILMGILCESIPTSIAVASIYFMIQFYQIKLPIDEIIQRLKINGAKLEIDEKKIKKRKKTSDKALMAELTNQSDVTISKTYKKMQPWKEIITANIKLSDNALDIKVSEIKPKLIK